MGIFDWLFGSAKPEQKKQTRVAEVNVQKPQFQDSYDKEYTLRETFVSRVTAFKKDFKKSDAYKNRKSKSLSKESEKKYLKEWSKFMKTAKKLKKEQSDHFTWARLHTDSLFEYDLQKNYFVFPSDNPYEVAIAMRETRTAISKDWPTSELRQQCIDLIDQHFLVLKRSFRDAVIKNKYGKIEEDKRLTELRIFLMEFKLLHKLEKFSRNRFATKKYREKLRYEFCLGSGFLPQNDLLKYIKKKIKDDERTFKINGFDPEAYPIDGIEFERWVEAQLLAFGWVAKATQAASDQGVDILAEKDGVTIAVQCKRYSKPVGNKAVQEITAGMQHYLADYGAVIATAKYTKSAIQLAKTNNIHLLSVDDIPSLYSLISS